MPCVLQATLLFNPTPVIWSMLTELGMETYKKRTVLYWYQYQLKGTVLTVLLTVLNFINTFSANSHVKDPEQPIINDNFAVVIIVNPSNAEAIFVQSTRMLKIFENH